MAPESGSWPASSKMANASTWPSTNRASDRSRVAQSASAAKRAGVRARTRLREHGRRSPPRLPSAPPTPQLGTPCISCVSRLGGASTGARPELSHHKVSCPVTTAELRQILALWRSPLVRIRRWPGLWMLGQFCTEPRQVPQTAATDRGVALCRYELGLSQVEDQFFGLPDSTSVIVRSNCTIEVTSSSPSRRRATEPSSRWTHSNVERSSVLQVRSFVVSKCRRLHVRTSSGQRPLIDHDVR